MQAWQNESHRGESHSIFAEVSMHRKQFSLEGKKATFTASLEGETRRIVQITRDDHPGQPFLTLDPVDHDVAHAFQAMSDEAFLDFAIHQAIQDHLIDKALESHGPVVALLKH
jgi:hypothetical protein